MIYGNGPVCVRILYVL